ncbi:MAG: hypothetical protein BWY73_01124 [candidate division TA06 bacterium ADurb.Bin417]|uniref:Uncharacterized protein n=1 Tax=candidate division TA06 bacterium ADurb.Bin417 TaxID=1852828 RepID=A0A1V5MEG4_UNCT6|nr:MAG: hypothetical protein BWY73_01124 [candidate division TA06 bacterium ADurb.Bin417]
MVFRIEKTASGIKALKAAGVKVLTAEEIYRL